MENGPGPWPSPPVPENDQNPGKGEAWRVPVQPKDNKKGVFTGLLHQTLY